MWHAADGRPTLELCNGFSKPRIPDGYVLGQEDNYAVPYADSYMRAVEDLLVSRGFPRLYPLPVHNENVCDLALYFAGDDDATSEENDMAAAEAMFQRGLPYHLNLMPVDEEGRGFASAGSSWNSCMPRAAKRRCIIISLCSLTAKRDISFKAICMNRLLGK